jgi:O-antigen ligase
MTNKNMLQLILFLILGIIAGTILYFSVSVDIPLYWTIMIMCLIFFPFFVLWEKISKKVLLAILTLSLPFTVDQTINIQDHTGGAQGFIVSMNGIAIIILFILLLYEKFQNRKIEINLHIKASLPFYGIIIMAIFSMINAVDRGFSFYELSELIKMYLIFLVIANYITDQKYFNFVLFFLIAGIFMESLIVMLQKATGSSLNLSILGGEVDSDLSRIGTRSIYRVGGTLGGANALAWYLDFLIPVPFALLFYKMKKHYKILLGLTILLGLAALFFTYSRAGWFCLLLSFLVVIYFNLKKISVIQRVYLTLLFIILLSISATLLIGTSNPVKNRLFADDRGSAYVRIPLMKVAWTMIKANPIIGVGLNNYTEVDQEYDTTPENITTFFPLPVHNIYLQLAAEIGIPGLLFFLWFLGSIYYRSIKYMNNCPNFSKSVIIGIIGGLSGFLIHGLVENSSIARYHLLPVWFLSGIITGIIQKNINSE